MFMPDALLLRLKRSRAEAVPQTRTQVMLTLGDPSTRLSNVIHSEMTVSDWLAQSLSLPITSAFIRWLWLVTRT